MALVEVARNVAPDARRPRVVAEDAARLTTVGIAFVFVTAIIVMLTIDRAFNQTWRVPRLRGTA